MLLFFAFLKHGDQQIQGDFASDIDVLNWILPDVWCLFQALKMLFDCGKKIDKIDPKLSALPMYQSFPYENHGECYKKLVSRLWHVLFTLTCYFLQHTLSSSAGKQSC